MSYLYRDPKPIARKRSPEFQPLLDLLDEFVENNAEEPIRLLSRLWSDQGLVLTYSQIKEWILAGDVDVQTLFDWQNDYAALVASTMTPMWTSAISTGFSDIPYLNWLSDTAFEYNPASAGIQTWIRDHGAELVSSSTSTQRKAIQNLVANAMDMKMGVDELARQIRPVIGLTSRQATANLNYYNTVKETIAEQHPRMSMKNVEAKAHRASLRYAEKQHRYRAQTIARTEMANAYNYGAQFGIEQAIDAGFIEGSGITKTWVTSRLDAKVCAVCSALEGVTIPLEEDFDAGPFGMVPHPTAHPNCMCLCKYNIPIQTGSLEVEIEDEVF